MQEYLRLRSGQLQQESSTLDMSTIPSTPTTPSSDDDDSKALENKNDDKENVSSITHPPEPSQLDALLFFDNYAKIARGGSHGGTSPSQMQVVICGRGERDN